MWVIRHLEGYRAAADYVEGIVVLNLSLPVEHSLIELEGQIIDPKYPDAKIAYFPGLRFTGREGVAKALAIPKPDCETPDLPIFYRFGLFGSLSPEFPRAREAAHRLTFGDERPPFVPWLIPDGRYHVALVQVERGRSSGHPVFTLTFNILRSEGGMNTNRTIIEQWPVTQDNLGRAQLFARCLDLLDENEVGEGVVPLNWTDALGRQLVVEVVTAPSTEEGRPFIPYVVGAPSTEEGGQGATAICGVWRTDDPEVAVVPKYRPRSRRRRRREE